MEWRAIEELNSWSSLRATTGTESELREVDHESARLITRDGVIQDARRREWTRPKGDSGRIDPKPKPAKTQPSRSLTESAVHDYRKAWRRIMALKVP